MPREIFLEAQEHPQLLDQFGGTIPPSAPSRPIWQNSPLELAEFTTPEQNTERIREIFEQNNESHFLLEGSGFDVLIEVQNIYKTLETAGRHEILHDRLKQTIIGSVSENLRSYYWEFLVNEPVLPIDLEIDQNVIVAPRFGYQRLIDVIDPEERDAAMLQAVLELEKEICNAEDDTMFLITSPPGWTGNTDRYGRSEILPQSQTYLYKKTSGSIKATTLRTSMSLSDHLALLRSYGVIVECPDHIEEIKTVCRTVINISRSHPNSGFEDVVDHISRVMGTEYIWTPGDNREKGAETYQWKVEEIKEKIRYIDHLKKADIRTELRILQLEEFLRNNLDNFTEDEIIIIARELGKAAMDISHALRTNKTQIKYFESQSKLHHPNQMMYLHQYTAEPNIDYRQESVSTRQHEGCRRTAGGFKNIQNTVFGPKEISVTGEDKYGSLEFDCPHCGYTNTRPFGKLIKNCQDCGRDVTC